MTSDSMEKPGLIRPVPMAILPPAFAYPLDGLLHCFALDSGQSQTVHLSVDVAGQLVELPLLPLSIGGLTACARQLILTGQTSGDYRPIALALAPDGHPDWQCAFDPDQSLRLAHQPVDLRDNPAAVWVTDDADLEVWLARIGAKGVDNRGHSRVAGPAYGFSVIPSGERLWLGFLAGIRLRYEVLEIADGRPGSSKTVIDSLSSVPPCIVATGNRFVAAWVSTSGQELYLRWFDSRFDPLSSPQKLITIPEPASIRTIQLYSSARGSLVISYLTTRAGEMEPLPTSDDSPDRYVETEFVEHSLQFIEDDRPTPSVSINPPGSVIHAGGWLGNRFVLLHGSESTCVSIF